MYDYSTYEDIDECRRRLYEFLSSTEIEDDS